MNSAGFLSVWIVAGAIFLVVLAVALRWVYRKLGKRRAWTMIRAEREDNKNRFTRSAGSFAAIAQQLQTNRAAIEALRTRTDISQESLAALVVWNCDLPDFNSAAWQTVRRTGLNRLFKACEEREVEELYTDFCVLHASMAKVRREIETESRHARAGSAETAPQWVADELERIQAVRIAHDKLGAEMRYFTHLHTDFVPTV